MGVILGIVVSALTAFVTTLIQLLLILGPFALLGIILHVIGFMFYVRSVQVFGSRLPVYLLGMIGTFVHEVIGHGSGLVSERLKGDPSEAIGEYYSALEEGRADLVALWFLGDPKLVELGLVSERDRGEIERTGYEGYARRALAQLSRVRRGRILEEDHMRSRQMIVHWLMDNTDAIEVKRRDGKTFYVVVDVAAGGVVEFYAVGVEE